MSPPYSFKEFVERHGSARDRELAGKGFDMRPQGMGLVVDRARAGLAAAVGADRVRVVVHGSPEHGALTLDGRRDPSDEALRLHSKVASVVAELDIPLEAGVQVLPVQRVTWNGRAVDRAKRDGEPIPPRECSTAVVVRLVAPKVGERLVIVSAEPLPPEAGQHSG